MAVLRGEPMRKVPSIRFVRPVVAALALAASIGGPRSARAQQVVPVVIDRDSTVLRLRQMAEQIGAIEQQVGGPGRKGGGGGGRDVLGRTAWIKQALASIEQAVSQAPPSMPC